MSTRTRNKRFLLSSVALLGALTGYGRGAYAACDDKGSATFECSGIQGDQVAINADNAAVTILDGFTLNTSDNTGISITGDGALSFTDAIASSITAASVALFIDSDDDAGTTDGSVTVDTNGTLTGGVNGIGASNNGSGALSITANGEVNGTSGNAIVAQNGALTLADGTYLTVTTGADSKISGGNGGIAALNFGTGTLSITANGEVSGTSGHGIGAVGLGSGAMSVTANSKVTGGLSGISAVLISGTDLSVTTGIGSTVSGGDSGITARASGSGSATITANGDVDGGATGILVTNTGSGGGALSVTANGKVSGTSGNGIEARNGTSTAPAGTDLTVTTGADSTVAGGDNGISAKNYGSGAVGVTAHGDVEGSAHGIYAVNINGTSLTVLANGNIEGGGTGQGIQAINDGSGALSVTANGEVTGTAGGILARNSAAGTDLTVTTGADSTIRSDNKGIYVTNVGTGITRIITNGDVESTTSIGIHANVTGADALTIIANGYVMGGAYGIAATQTGSGALDVTANGDVVGGGYGISATANGSGAVNVTANGKVTAAALHAIFAKNTATGTDVTVTTGADSDITGADIGIQALNLGTGALSVTANGEVSGASGSGINAKSGTLAAPTGTDITVTTGADSKVTGSEYGIYASSFGSGAVSVTVHGDVTGGTSGIFASNLYGSSVTVIADGDISGSMGQGIIASNVGSGAVSVTANGDVMGSFSGIIARNFAAGTDVSVTTGADSDIHGDLNGVYAENYGTGITRIITNGDVSGGRIGILALNKGSGALSVTANGNVDGQGDSGIDAQNGYVSGTDIIPAGTDLTVTTSADSIITAADDGIHVLNFGTGATLITANGDVDGGSVGIAASALGTSLTVIANADVTGGKIGIVAANGGSGAVSVTANGNVIGEDRQGIYVQNYATGTDINVTTGAGSTVTGDTSGIDAVNSGTGAVTIIANGDVTGTENLSNGINATTKGTDLSITTGAGTIALGDIAGIRGDNTGSGALTITANGDATARVVGILANGFGTSLTVISNGDVTGAGFAGIFADDNGTGATTVTANGNVSSGRDAIFAQNSSTGTDIIVSTGAGSFVTGATSGIRADNRGSGEIRIVTNGAVEGGATGIVADHTGGGLTSITVGSGSTVSSTGVTPDDLAILVRTGTAHVTVAGTLNSGGVNAVSFSQEIAFDDTFELHPTAVINGRVLGGLGSDTLAFGGSGAGAFNLTDIDTGAATQQYQEFETFEVDNGEWSFTGATTLPFTVNGGTVKGTGTFGDITFNGGTLAPGNSIGTLNVIGALTLGAGSVYEVEVNAAGQSDKVIVQGTVNLTGAALSVLAENGDYALSTDYTIIDNDGTDAVVGTFATITSSLAFLTPSVLYNAGTGNDVVLTLERNESDFCSVANSRNQCNVATALDGFPTGNDLYLAVVNQTAAGARQAFDALSGEIHATVAGVLADDNRYVREAILGRLMQAGHTDSSLGTAGPQIASIDANAMALGYDDKSLAPAPSSALAFWTRAYGAWGDYDGNNNAASADRDLGGFMSGMDASIGGSWRVGLTTGASYSNVSVNSRNSSADAESYYLGGYAGGMAGAFALRGGGTWAWSDIDTSRAVVFPGFFERQKASYDANTGQIFGEVAYPTTMGGASVEPFAGLAYVSVDTDSFRERGGALASLRGRDTDQNVGYSTLGFRAATTTQWGATMVTPHISAAWQHAFNDVTPDAALAFTTTGIGFNVTGVPLAKNSALIDAGLDFALAENLTAGVSYSGQFGNGVQDNAVKGQFTWIF